MVEAALGFFFFCRLQKERRKRESCRVLLFWDALPPAQCAQRWCRLAVKLFPALPFRSGVRDVRASNDNSARAQQEEEQRNGYKSNTCPAEADVSKTQEGLDNLWVCCRLARLACVSQLPAPHAEPMSMRAGLASKHTWRFCSTLSNGSRDLE